MRQCGGTTRDGYQCQRRHWLDSDDRCKDHPIYLDTYYDWRPIDTTLSVVERWKIFVMGDETKTPEPTRVLVDVSEEPLEPQEPHDPSPPVDMVPQITDAQSVGKFLDDTREKLRGTIAQLQRINEDIASLKTSIQLYGCMTTLGAGGDLTREIERSKEELVIKCDKLGDLSADIARFQQQLRSFTGFR